MKTFSRILAFGSLVLLSALARAGGDSSVGGGGGSLRVTSIYTPGRFEVSGFSEKTGIVDEIRKYFVAAGAVRNEGANMNSYSHPSHPNDSWINEYNTLNPESTEYYHLNFKIAFTDMVEIRSGFNEMAQVTYIGFRGVLADDLYLGMEKAGVEPSGWTVDPSKPDQKYGFIYQGDRVTCEKNPLFGVWCNFIFGNRGK